MPSVIQNFIFIKEEIIMIELWEKKIIIVDKEIMINVRDEQIPIPEFEITIYNFNSGTFRFEITPVYVNDKIRDLRTVVIALSYNDASEAQKHISRFIKQIYNKNIHIFDADACDIRYYGQCRPVEDVQYTIDHYVVIKTKSGFNHIFNMSVYNDDGFDSNGSDRCCVLSELKVSNKLPYHKQESILTEIYGNSFISYQPNMKDEFIKKNKKDITGIIEIDLGKVVDKKYFTDDKK